MLKTVIGALAVAVTVPAAAAPAMDYETRVVRYDDLDLASSTGFDQLEKRIDVAARAVCGARAGMLVSPSELALTRACMVQAKAKAAKQVAALQPQATRGG